MSAWFVDSDRLHAPRGYRHAAVTTGGATIHCAGQVSMDVEGRVVGVGDHQAQAHHALLNVTEAVVAAGGAATDLVKLTYYVVGMDAEAVTAVHRGLATAYRAAGLPAVPATMVGVTALADPDLLIEIDGVAVCAELRDAAQN